MARHIFYLLFDKIDRVGNEFDLVHDAFHHAVRIAYRAHSPVQEPAQKHRKPQNTQGQNNVEKILTRIKVHTTGEERMNYDVSIAQQKKLNNTFLS